MTTTAAPILASPTTRRVPRYFLISAWSIPVLVVGQFALLAVIPVVLVLVGALRDARLRTARPQSIALAATYVTPLVIWVVRPDGARSLSRDMHPGFTALIVVASALVLLKTRTPKS